MPPLTMTIEELSGSGRSTHSYDSGNADERIFLCHWNNRFSLADQLAGQPHPVLPYCYVHTVRIEPLSADLSPSDGASIDPENQVVAYAQNGGKVALVRAIYATDYKAAPWPCEITKPSISDGTALSLRIKSAGQFLTIPASLLRWSDNAGGDPTDQMPAPDNDGRLLIPIREFHLEWDYIDDPPVEAWDALIGKVNSEEFLGCAAETLLFEAYDLEPAPKFKPTDPFGFRMTTVLKHRKISAYTPGEGEASVGWNHDLRADGWQRIKVDDGSGNVDNRYKLTDFSDMFTQSSCSEE